MNNKKIGLFLVLFAVGYFIFITLVAGHGVMTSNVFSSGVALIIGIYYLTKGEG